MSGTVEYLTGTFYAGADQRVNLACFSDAARSTAYDLSGRTLKARVRRPDGASTIYTATVTTNTGGEGYITLDSSWHEDGGYFLLTVLVDGAPFDTIKRGTLTELP